MLARIAAVSCCFASAAAAGTVGIKVVSCCDTSCKADISQINAPATAPNPGSFSFNGTGTLNEALTAPTLEITVKMGGINVLDKTMSACGDQQVSLPQGCK